MPKREDEFWAAREEPERTKYCPKCGNSNISYSEKFHSWRCNGCEHNFNVPSFESKGERRPKIPWDDKWFAISGEKEPPTINEHEENLKPEKEPKEEIEEEHEEVEQEYTEAKIDDKTSSKSKAWFGNEYFDKKTRKWKKPGTKASSIVISIIALVVIIVIVVVFLLYVFVFTQPVS